MSPIASQALADRVGVDDVLAAAGGPRALAAGRERDAVEHRLAHAAARVVGHGAGALPAAQVEQVRRVDPGRGARDRQQLLARGRERRAERPLEALGGAPDRDLRARRAHGPAGRGDARLRRGGGRRGDHREGGEHEEEKEGSGHRKVGNRWGDIRRGHADGTGAAAIVAADGHRLAFDGGAGHDATDPRAARGGDRRRGRRAAPARLRAVVPQLRRALRARVGARHRRGADAGLHRPLRPHPAPARDPGLAGGGAVRPGRRLDHGLGRPALLRRAGVAHLPARRRALLRPGRRRGGAGGAHAPRARARRSARLPGHPVRRPDRVGGAARGAPAAARRAGARPARGGRADAPGGVGTGRALRALRLARRVEPRACRLRRTDRARARAVGADGLARDRRRAAFPARDGRAGRDGRPPPRPAHGPVLDRAVPRLHAARAARGRASRSGSSSPGASGCAAPSCRWRSPPRCSRCSSPARSSGCR